MTTKRNLKVLIVDDEVSAREGLANLIAESMFVKSIDTCSNGIEAIKFLKRQVVDLLFLDIQMPLVDGFDVLRSLTKKQLPFVVFVTAHDEYALKAFEYHALDYVLKPFSDKRIDEILERVYGVVNEREQLDKIEMLLKQIPNDKDSELVSYQSEKQLVFKENGVVQFLEQAEIEWVEAYDYYVKIHAGDKTHLVRTSIKKLLKSLDSKVFIQVHRSAVINGKMVKSIDIRSGDWMIEMNRGVKVKVGRTYKENLKGILGK